MAIDPSDLSERDRRLDEVLGAYLEALDAGQAPDRQELLASNPDLSPELESFFADQEQVTRWTEPLRPITQAALTDALAAAKIPLSSGLPPGSREGPGRRLGAYELLEEIGRGGMGVVFKARQEKLSRLVALKMIRGGPWSSTAELRRFRNEAETAAHLDHPHIVPIYEVGEHEGQLYFSMKLMEGGSLAGQLACFAAEPRAAARLLVTVAQAVHHAHQRGILHRDLKPSNILLDADGQPHVADFGLAKRVQGDPSLTQAGALVGTPSYMAPEQAAGKKEAITTATDVYGLGAILYALLTGRPPFREETVLDTLARVRACEPEPPSRGNAKVDRDLETICLKCLEKEPQRRYGSAKALAEDLERWLAGEPIEARPISRMTRLWWWCRRNPQLASLTGAVAVLGILIMIGLSVGTVWLWREKTQKEQALELAQENYKAAQDQQRESRRTSASLALDRGLLLCEQGEIARGLLWLARGLEIDPADAAGLHRALRANLGSWSRQLASLHSLSVPINSQQSNVRVDKPDAPAREAVSLAGASGLSEPANQSNRLGEANPGNPGSARTRPQGGVFVMAMSPDSRVVLTASRDKTARLWEIATGRPLGEPLWHQEDVACGAFSPDGRIVLTGSEDKTARLWETTTGRPLRRPLMHSAAVIAAAFSPNGKTVLTASRENQALLWEAATGKPLERQFSHPGEIKVVAFSPDGQTVLTGGWDATGKEGEAWLWDAATGKPRPEPLRHRSCVEIVAFSPDGQTILTGSADQTARLWEVTTGKLIGSPLAHKGPLKAAAFSPDSRSVVTGSHHSARLWETATGKALSQLLEHQDEVLAVAFSPDGASVLTGSSNHSVRIWELARRKRFGTILRHQAGIWAVAFSPDGRFVLTGSTDNTARLWDALSGKPLGQFLGHRGRVFCGAFSPDGKMVLTGSEDHTARLWEVATGKPLGPEMQHQHEVRAVAFHPDGHTVLTGSVDATARLWQVPTGKPLFSLLGHQVLVNIVAFSPNGRMLLTASRDGTVRLWEAATGEPIGSPLRHPDSVWAAAFSPDGQFVATGCGDSHVRLWEVATGRLIGEPLHHAGVVQAVAVSPDSRMVVTGSSDSTARIWDVATGKPLGPPLVHGGLVHVVAFSPDGRTIWWWLRRASRLIPGCVI